MKKSVSLLLVFSILALSVPLTAKERKGADLIVQRADGTYVRGELIAVKQSSLLLMEMDSGADVNADIDDIRVITILKKSKLLQGAVLGLLIGGGGGAGGAAIFAGEWEDGFNYPAMIGVGVLGAALGLLIGGYIGAASGKVKTIQIEGMSDSEIQEILEKLRKKARIRNSQ
jgi:hypothetical protein